MNKYLRIIFVIGLSLISVIQVSAEKKDSIEVKKSNLTIGLKYLSNNVYLGRIDSANIMYLAPSIAYTHKSGLHIGASLAYQLDAGINKIDAIALEGGYDFTIGTKFSGGLSVGKYFYDMNSIALNSVNDFGVGTNFSYDFSILTLNVGTGLGFNDKIDIITEAGINKSFEIGKFIVEPALKFNAGTQNYYNSYLVAGKSHLTGNTGHGKGVGKIKTTTTTSNTYSVVEASMYKMLDYEISVPVSYSFHHLKFDVVPTYAIPVNPATILSSADTVEKEVISNHFIMEVGIAYIFN